MSLSRSDLLENVREASEPLINQNLDLDEGELATPTLFYSFSFLIAKSEREIDVTVSPDGRTVSVVASSNERSSQASVGGLMPIPLLSAELSLPDDADTSSIKINMTDTHLTVLFARGERISPGHKLFVQAD